MPTQVNRAFAKIPNKIQTTGDTNYHFIKALISSKLIRKTFFAAEVFIFKNILIFFVLVLVLCFCLDFNYFSFSFCPFYCLPLFSFSFQLFYRHLFCSC